MEPVGIFSLRLAPPVNVSSTPEGYAADGADDLDDLLDEYVETPEIVSANPDFQPEPRWEIHISTGSVCLQTCLQSTACVKTSEAPLDSSMCLNLNFLNLIMSPVLYI
jgi:hypothetical protein